MESALEKAGCRFVCSYRGAADYVYKGRKYVVRSFASDDGYYNGDCYQTDILPMVGCIRSDNSEHWHDFPPAEVCALFPHYVPCRLTEDYEYEYKDGVKPRTITNYRNETYAASWYEELYGKTDVVA